MSSHRPRVAMRARHALLLAGFGVSACQAPNEPPFPSNAVLMTPPPVYQLWWNLVERCSGLSGDFNAVRFYQEPGQTTATAGADSANAYWFAAGNRIVVGGLNAFDGPVLRHEMLHALLGPTGASGHPQEYFVSRCGGIVHCSSVCQQEGGPIPTPSLSAPAMSPSQLNVSVRVDPAQMDPAQYDGWMAITVSATNPSEQAVWVNIPQDARTESVKFGYSIAGRTLDWLPAYDSQVGFMPGQTEQQMFDIQVAPGVLQLAPGQYDLRGFFATDTTPPANLVVLAAAQH